MNRDKFMPGFARASDYVFNEIGGPPVNKKLDIETIECKPEEEVRDDVVELSWTEEFPKDLGPIIYSDGKKTTALKELRHTALFGTTGMGKTRSHLIPSVISSGKSGQCMVIGDCKGDLHEATSGILKSMGYKVKVLNFANPLRSDCFSLFKEAFKLIKSGIQSNIDLGKTLAKDISKILCPKESERDPHWEIVGASMIYSLIIVAILESKSSEEITINRLMEIRNAITDDPAEINRYCEMAKDHEDVVSNLKTFNMDAKGTQSCYMVFVDQSLTKYSFSKTLQTLLSADDIGPEILLEEKTAIFIIFPEETHLYDSMTSTIVKIMYETLIRESREYPGKKLPHRVHFLLDEFVHMPLVDFSSTISTARSRGIQFTLVIQSYSQLVDRFGAATADNILNNCTLWIFLGGSDEYMMGRIAKFGRDMDTCSLLYINRRKGDAVVREVNRPSYFTKLMDLSHYEIELPEQLELPTNHWAEDENGTKKPEGTDEFIGISERGESVVLNNTMVKMVSIQALHNISSAKEFKEFLRKNKHIDGVSQKTISDIMKWLDYDPKPEFRTMCENSKLILSYGSKKKGALIDFIAAFSIMDPEFKMLDLMMFSISEWSRLRQVMVSEGWTPEEADEMKHAIRSMLSGKVQMYMPDDYIGILRSDKSFNRIIEDMFIERYGNVPMYNTELLRDLVFAMQLDYNAPAFRDFLFKYIDTNEIDLEPHRDALCFQSEEYVDNLKFRMITEFGFKTVF